MKNCELFGIIGGASFTGIMVKYVKNILIRLSRINVLVKNLFM